ncbi:monooxygenase [Lizonia empirigonia]|nr:monooxygenase [Lizonia empirigonia]
MLIFQFRRQLSKLQKKSYIEAVLCLTKKSAISGIDGAVNRFDDHEAAHSSQTPEIHWVGHFILWHRYFVATYEKALRDNCGYTGGQPYWDWSQDAEPHNPNSTKIFTSAIFDPDTGFGGNGDYIAPTTEQNPFNITDSTGSGCVQTGPFTPSKFMLNYPERDCLRREFNPRIMNTFANPALVNDVLAQKDYTSFARAIENVPSFDQPNIHGSGHFGVGGVLGTIGKAANSPGGTLYHAPNSGYQCMCAYVHFCPVWSRHHANLDHVLWMWQQKDLKARLNQVGGPILPFDYNGKNVTLDFEVNISRLAGNTTLKDLLNTQGKTLCYTY